MRALAVCAAVAGALAWPGAAGAQNLLNCSDFPSQAAAQASLRANPRDPDRLDADRDGIACEHLPGARDEARVVYCEGACGLTRRGPQWVPWSVVGLGR